MIGHYNNWKYSQILLLLVSIYCCEGAKTVKFIDRVCIKQPLDVGKECVPPKPPVKTYYFNVKNESCGNFQYLGCGGNENRFLNSDECIDSCQTAWFLKKNKEESQAPKEERQASDCLLTPESGPCKAMIVMWYYDKEQKNCSTFIYGGCQGNPNKFDSIAQCEDFCASKA